MRVQSVILSIQKIGERFIHREILDWFYIGIVLLLIAGIIIVSISTLTFLLRTFNVVVFASDKDITSEVPFFNITGLKIIAPRFGIIVNDTPSHLVEPQQTQKVPLATPIVSTPLPFAELKLHILNGTRISGLAGIWKKRFEAKGLNEVSTGNAPERNMKGITITYKPEKEIFLEIVREVFKQQGSVIVHENVDNSLSDDMVIVIGK